MLRSGHSSFWKENTQTFFGRIHAQSFLFCGPQVPLYALCYQWLRLWIPACHLMHKSPMRSTLMASAFFWKNIFDLFLTPQPLLYQMLRAAPFALSSWGQICPSLFTDWTCHHTYHPEFLVHPWPDTMATQEHGSAGLYNAHYARMEVVRWLAPSPIVRTHMQDTGHPPKKWPSEPWQYVLALTVDIELSIRQLLPEYQTETLMENGVPHEDVQPHFDDITDQRGLARIICDAADGNMVSRPRLWWNTIHWPEVRHAISTKTPWQLQWSHKEQYEQLHNPVAPDLQPSVHIKGWETPNILTQGGIFHCLTTQAPTDNGRPPPQHSNVDQAREANHTQFPPWRPQSGPASLTKSSRWSNTLQNRRNSGTNPYPHTAESHTNNNKWLHRYQYSCNSYTNSILHTQTYLTKKSATDFPS